MGDLPVSIVVPPAVYGPRDLDFYVYFRFVRRGIIPLIGMRAHHLSLIYVQDLADAVAAVLLSEHTVGRSYLVDDGCIQTWTSVADAIACALVRKPKRVRMPVAAARSLGAIGDICARLTGKVWLINSQKVREFLQTSWTCSSQRIRDELGFRPQYSLERGIRETLSWYQENKWL